MTQHCQPLRGLAANRDLLARLHGDGGDPPRPVVESEPESPLVATPGQEQVWFFDQLVPGGVFHTVPVLAQVSGPLDVTALQQALDAVVARHEPLRTRFVAAESAPVPVVEERASVGVDVHDLTPLAPGGREEAAGALFARELARPFDLRSAPLLRATLARLSSDDHRLLIAAHHIAVDGHSLGILERELVAAYRAFAATGKAPELAPLPLRYRDLARQEGESAAAPKQLEHLEYWRQALADRPEPLALPFARPGAAESALAADDVPFELPGPVEAALRQFAREAQVSPFMAMLTAFAVLLHRCSGASDFVLGMPSGGRERPGSDELIGYFVNMLALRLRLPADPTWREALSLVRDAALEAFDHRQVPFHEVVRAVGADRRLDSHPVFQIVFASSPPLAGTHDVAGTTFTFTEATSTEALYDVELQVHDAPGGISGFLKYKTARYDRRDIEAVAARFLGQLQQLVTEPDTRLSNLSLLGPAEWSQIVDGWNRTTTNYPRSASVPDLFEGCTRRTPDAVALELGDERLTYRQLDERANQLAHRLQAAGVGPESRVAICLGPRADWVVAALAALKAGGAYVPLDADYPADRLSFMCVDSGAQVLLVSEGTADLAVAPGVPRLVMEHEQETIARLPVSRPARRCGPGSLAYVMYTSGSTGRPKGVAVTHGNIVRLVRDTNYITIRSGDTLAQASNVSFDAATLEVWGALLNGGRLVGVPKDVVLDAGRLGEWLGRHQVDILFLTTSVAMNVAREAPEALSSLRYFIFGGEQADARAVARLVNHRAAPEHVVNGYGPTETTTFSTTFRCDRASSGDNPLPIGWPISNTRQYVLDRYLQPVPVGQVGELYVSGDGVGRGYVNNPELTADRFLPDHLGGPPGSRMYKTGDLVRQRPDGAVEYLGRADRQVKIRGFRIEPGEIEACLHRSGWARQAAVVVRPDPAGDARLLAYVVPSRADVTLDQVRAHLRAELPDYMVPSAVMAVAGLPLTANGKLDISALPEPEAQAALTEEAPRTPTEQRVAAIWAEVLGLPALGRQANFFDLGGHSLKATRVMARINAALGTAAPLRLLFEQPTLARLASSLDGLGAAAPSRGVSPAMRAVRRNQLSVEDLLDAIDQPVAG